MTSLQRTFPVVFILGVTALAASIAFSQIDTGVLFGMHPFVVALRAFGVGYMAAGAALWVCMCRCAGGRPGLQPLFMLLLLLGSGMLALSVLMPMSIIAPTLNWAGIAFNGSALLIGLIATLIDPAYPAHLATTWPDGGTAHPDPHVPAIDLHRPEFLTVEPDDLTRIAGIGPQVERVLNQSGIVTFNDLLRRSPHEIETIIRDAHIRIPLKTAEWRKQAEQLVKGGTQGRLQFG